ncbi:hypothetical protein J3E68DRAFT_411495 [Trichoderma sp. SZMC 28012]
MLQRLQTTYVLFKVFCGIYISRLKLKRARVLLVYLYTLVYLFQQPQASAVLSFANFLNLHRLFLFFISISINVVADIRVIKRSVNQGMRSCNIAALTNQHRTKPCRTRARHRSTSSTPHSISNHNPTHRD